MERLLWSLADDLLQRGQLNLDEGFIDGTFVPAKKGSRCRTNQTGKGTKLMAIADAHGLPIALHLASASAHEVTLVSSTVAARLVSAKPQRLIGDKAYDSDLSTLN